ncbi:hypothetical protein BDU57DRAFT_592178 [Ampelomyces quisqualis]|uniref:Uncharacterized protein n=1 Tax=Ampelomyces quisqualis TaxID=50730 RepID=A0A6A5R3G1_AMPQU|nr:hypothetical protein BDU57DRAFT_592178 [Ampelomyces quisqualis]
MESTPRVNGEMTVCFTPLCALGFLVRRKLTREEEQREELVNHSVTGRWGNPQAQWNVGRLESTSNGFEQTFFCTCGSVEIAIYRQLRDMKIQYDAISQAVNTDRFWSDRGTQDTQSTFVKFWAHLAKKSTTQRQSSPHRKLGNTMDYSDDLGQEATDGLCELSDPTSSIHMSCTIKLSPDAEDTLQLVNKKRESTRITIHPSPNNIDHLFRLPDPITPIILVAAGILPPQHRFVHGESEDGIAQFIVESYARGAKRIMR